jgi:antitoxin (DNA-binding transcriptional repressor) of toxin-antitoxin stability system
MDDGVLVIGASEFKAKCLDLMDRLAAGELTEIVVTKHRRAVAVLRPPPAPPEVAAGFFGFMRGRVIAPEGFDFTAPVLDEPLDADDGRLHR